MLFYFILVWIMLGPLYFHVIFGITLLFFTKVSKILTEVYWIKRLFFGSHDTMKVLEENTGREISDIPRSSIFTNMSPRARDIKERINKWYFAKIKSSTQLKKTSAKWIGNQHIGRYICQWYFRQGFDLQNILWTHMTPLQKDKQSN